MQDLVVLQSGLLESLTTAQFLVDHAVDHVPVRPRRHHDAQPGGFEPAAVEVLREMRDAGDDARVAPAEASGLTDSPDYRTTVAWLRKLVEASPKLKMTSLGKSHEGRDLWAVVASKEGAGTA